MVSAMSTLPVDDQLFQRTIEVAASQGKSIEEFVDEALRKAVGGGCPQVKLRNGLPTMVVNGVAPAIDPRKVRQSLEEDGF
jgi:hypothetical protein